MAGSINKVTLIGNLGRDPEIRATKDGREIANLAIATSDTWKDKQTGERKEKTEWHRVAIFNEGLVNVVKNYLRKGSKVYIEGSLQTRKWVDNNNQERYTTEIVLQGYNGNLTMLDSKGSGGAASGGMADAGASQSYSQPAQAAAPAPAAAELDDEIPF